jgi:hypothetical protein
MPVIIDPALYMKKKGDLFWIPQKRELPTAFKLFGGTHSYFAASAANLSSIIFLEAVCPQLFFRVYTTPNLN